MRCELSRRKRAGNLLQGFRQNFRSAADSGLRLIHVLLAKRHYRAYLFFEHCNEIRHVFFKLEKTNPSCPRVFSIRGSSSIRHFSGASRSATADSAGKIHWSTVVVTTPSAPP